MRQQRSRLAKGISVWTHWSLTGTEYYLDWWLPQISRFPVVAGMGSNLATAEGQGNNFAPRPGEMCTRLGAKTRCSYEHNQSQLELERMCRKPMSVNIKGVFQIRHWPEMVHPLENIFFRPLPHFFKIIEALNPENNSSNCFSASVPGFKPGLLRSLHSGVWACDAVVCGRLYWMYTLRAALSSGYKCNVVPPEAS